MSSNRSNSKNPSANELPTEIQQFIQAFSLTQTQSNSTPAPLPQAMEEKAKAEPGLGFLPLTGDPETDKLALAFVGDDIDLSSYDARAYHMQSGLTVFTDKLPTSVLQNKIKKLLQHAVLARAEDIQEIKKILDEPLSRKPPNLNYLRALLCTPATVTDHRGYILDI